MARTRVVAKPKNDAYTTMLIFTFGAIVIGCVLMFLDAEQYKEAPPPPSSPALVLPKLGAAPPPPVAAPVVPEPVPMPPEPMPSAPPPP